MLQIMAKISLAQMRIKAGYKEQTDIVQKKNEVGNQKMGNNNCDMNNCDMNARIDESRIKMGKIIDWVKNWANALQGNFFQLLPTHLISPEKI